MRDTKYAKELARAEFKDCRIERLLVKEGGKEEIRFSWWPDGKMAVRPLDMPEDELLLLLQKAFSEKVFTDSFKLGLIKSLLTQSV